MTRLFILCLCLLMSSAVFAQFIGFEEQVPETFTAGRGSKLELSSLYYKEGTQCLQWNYLPGATLDVSTEPLRLDTKKEVSHGITLWIYNEKSQNDSIRIAFLNKAESDSWHTLLTAKTISALLMPDERERERVLKGLSRWVSTSLNYTQGTIGGIKVDDTTFHHGGFYPAYTTGVLAMVGQSIAFTGDTDYEVSVDGCQALKSAFLAMRNYCNLYEWGIGRRFVG